MLLQYRKRHLVRLIIKQIINNAEWRLLLYSLNEDCGNATAAAAGILLRSAKKKTKSCLHTNCYWLVYIIFSQIL